MGRRVLIVGGVAGGAACAARLRRMDEEAEIIIFDRGPYVSFANCGLPYFVGGVIPDERDLLVAGVEVFRDRLGIEVHVRTEVVAIDRVAKTIRVRDLSSGAERSEPYDALVLSPGASPIRPPLPGIDLPGIFTLRSIPDSRAIREWIEMQKPKSAVVIGAGFIGLEMTENLVRRGIAVTVIEKLDQVMPPFDPEMADLVAAHLAENGVSVALGEAVAGFEMVDAQLVVKSESGRSFSADLVILAIGVRPETGLARAAGLQIGDRGGIAVDHRMQTSDPSIWAVGDAVEVEDWNFHTKTLLPLAGPAARQGRIAADVICGRNAVFRGVQGTAICQVFDLQVASTGSSEKALHRIGESDFAKVYLHPNQHAGYYPGARPMTLKLVFRNSDGRILGAQAIGEDGIDRRIDVIAMAIQKHGTVYDLEEAELCYAPQFGGAKDPVNFAGMLAANTLRGDAPIAQWSDPRTPETLFLDVRDPDEFVDGHAVSAVNIPLNQLRARLDELPKDRPIRAYCAVGQRGYLATRILIQHGFKDVKNMSGGWKVQRAATNSI